MATIKVRSSVNTLGLSPGDEAEIEVTPQVEGAVSLGHLIVLGEAAVAPVEAPEEDKAAPKRKKAAASVQDDTEAVTDSE